MTSDGYQDSAGHWVRRRTTSDGHGKLAEKEAEVLCVSVCRFDNPVDNLRLEKDDLIPQASFAGVEQFENGGDARAFVILVG